MTYQIEAKHMGLGMVVFTLEAPSDKQAFTVWKQIVGNPRQWIIRSNVPVTVTKGFDNEEIEEESSKSPLRVPKRRFR